MRIDHDNSSVASAAVYDQLGAYLFVALETSREVAVIDAYGGRQVLRFDVGRAPQGLALSADGRTLYVNNSWTARVGVFDLKPLLDQGLMSVPLVANAGRRRHREARGQRAARQAALLRRPRHPPRARSLHQLRLLPQRWRPRRPRLGPHRLRRRPAQHHQPARPRRRGRGLPALEQQLRRSAGLRRTDPQPVRRHRPDDRRAVLCRHAQPAAGRSPRPACPPTSTRWRPTSLR